jgi:hypothetical protein
LARTVGTTCRGKPFPVDAASHSRSAGADRALLTIYKPSVCISLSLSCCTPSRLTRQIQVLFTPPRYVGFIIVSVRNPSLHLPDTRSLSLYPLTRIQRFIIPCNLVYYTATNSNRQRRIKFMKKWLKWGYHENCDTSDISTNFQKFFWIREEG